jgi:hypothetical protein
MPDSLTLRGTLWAFVWRAQRRGPLLPACADGARAAQARGRTRPGPARCSRRAGRVRGCTRAPRWTAASGSAAVTGGGDGRGEAVGWASVGVRGRKRGRRPSPPRRDALRSGCEPFFNFLKVMSKKLLINRATYVLSAPQSASVMRHEAQFIHPHVTSHAPPASFHLAHPARRLSRRPISHASAPPEGRLYKLCICSAGTSTGVLQRHPPPTATEAAAPAAPALRAAPLTARH